MTAAWKRHPLAIAVLLSLLLHLLMVWDGDFDIPDILKPDDPDQVLARKKAKEVPRVRLNIKVQARPKAQGGVPAVTLLHDTPVRSAPPPKPPAAPRKPAGKSAPQPVAAAMATAEPPSVPTVADSGPQAVDALATPLPPVTETQAAGPVAAAAPPPPAPAEEPPPAFPVELQARYRTAIMGVNVEFQQVWRMEGNNYIIDNTASKLGVRLRATSEGSITPDGIRPDTFKVYVNRKLQRFATFDYGTRSVSYGRPDNPHFHTIDDGIQDPFSIAYDVALGFSGAPRVIQFTTGTGLFRVQLFLVGEETLKLPGGIVRTLHVHGRSIDGSAFNVDVWLAPDHRNFPVKVSLLRHGDNIELSLKSLSFEGKQMIGDASGKSDKDEDGSLPKEWLDRPEFRDQGGSVSGLPGEDAP